MRGARPFWTRRAWVHASPRDWAVIAFHLTRYGGLFEDGSEAAEDRLDAWLEGGSEDSNNVLQLDTRKLR
jgi:hypothetical protein